MNHPLYAERRLMQSSLRRESSRAMDGTRARCRFVNSLDAGAEIVNKDNQRFVVSRERYFRELGSGLSWRRVAVIENCQAQKTYSQLFKEHTS